MMGLNFFEEVLKRKEDLLADLSELLKIESTKDVESGSDGEPMGKTIAEALDYMLHLSSEQGFHVHNHEGYYGYGDYGDGENDEHIAVLTHLDVVPATGQWTSPPFEPTIRDGKLFARGAIDDKGPTMAAFYAVKLLKELDLPMKKKVRIIFGTDEESGMSCLKKYREVEVPPVAGFAPDATFPIIHAEKGQMHVKCVLETTEVEESSSSGISLVSFDAGTRPNMVPETATAQLSGEVANLEESFRNYLSETGLNGDVHVEDNLATFTLKGISSHSMEPFKGRNAAVALATFLVSLPLDPNGTSYLSFVNEYFYEDHFGKKLGIAHEDEITGPLTVNPAIFQYDTNSGGSVHINIRFPVTATSNAIVEQFKAVLAKTDFSLGEVRSKNPHHVDKDTPMIKALQKAYEEETGEEGTLLSSGGNTYASLLPNCVAYGAVFPGKEMTAHQKDEYIEVDDLLKATAIYARAIYYLANMD